MDNTDHLTQEQLERYGRHIILSEIGENGQRKLLESKVLLIGAGGLGSPAAYYLAAAGVGTLGIVDSDIVERSNLQRQILHSTKDLGVLKTVSAVHKLEELNPEIRIRQHPLRVNSTNVLDLISEYDVVLDGADNLPTRFLMNDACILKKKPLIYAGVSRFGGQAFTIIPGKGPCYRCLFPEPPPLHLFTSCQEAGILGCVAGVMGTLQATEAIKVLLNLGNPLMGEMLIFDSLEMNFRKVPIHRDLDCPICGDHPTLTQLIDYEVGYTCG